MVNVKKFNKKLSLKSVSRKYKGFSLLELILVLGISSLVGISMVQYEAKRAAIQKAENAGTQLNLVGKALTSYINREIVTISTNMNNGEVITMPFDILRGVNQTVNGRAYLGREMLPTSFQPRSAFGPQFVLQLRKRNDRIEGLVITDRAICEKDNSLGCGTTNNPIKYDWIGAAMKKVGPYSGVTYNQANTLTGYNAGWQEVSGGAAGFTSINAAGLMAYKVFSTAIGDYDNIYLRLDGTSTMQGNLNMGYHNVNNATNIQYNGWLVGNNASLNLLRSGNIYNSGNIETVNAYATNDVNVGRDVNVLRNVNVGNDVNIGRDANVTNNLTVKRKTLLGEAVNDTTHIMGESYHNENSFFNKNVKVLESVGVNGRVGAPEIRTQDILFGSAYAAYPWMDSVSPPKQSGRTIPANMWLSDMIPRYSSRGIFYVNHGSTITKPACPGGVGNARIEVIPQNVATQGRVLGLLRHYLSNSYWDPAYRIDEYMIAQDQYSHGGFSVSVSNSGSAWTTYIYVSTYDSGLLPATNQTMLAHIYCDLGF